MNLENDRSLRAPGVTCVSLDYDHPALKRVMPRRGTSRGPDGIVRTSVETELDGDDEGGIVSHRRFAYHPLRPDGVAIEI